MTNSAEEAFSRDFSPLLKYKAESLVCSGRRALGITWYDLAKDQVQYQACAVGGTLRLTFSAGVFSTPFIFFYFFTRACEFFCADEAACTLATWVFYSILFYSTVGLLKTHLSKQAYFNFFCVATLSVLRGAFK